MFEVIIATPKPMIQHPSLEDGLLLEMLKRFDTDPSLRAVADAYLAMQEGRLAVSDSCATGDSPIMIGSIELFAEASFEFYGIAKAWFAAPLPEDLEKRQADLESTLRDWFRECSARVEIWREAIQTGGKPSREELDALEEKRVDLMFEIATLHCQLGECIILEGLSQN